MKLVLCLAVLVAVYCSVDSLNSPPKVQIYSRNPGEYGVENTIICHVSDFHPPDIRIEILKDGAELPNAKQTDLAFEKNWRFHLTKSVAFTPKKGEAYTCKVTHGDKRLSYSWEPNM